MEALLAQYEWIATDRQYFGQPNTAYDFETNNPKEASRRVEKLQEQKVSTISLSLFLSLSLSVCVCLSKCVCMRNFSQDKLSKTVNMRAMNMLGKAEERVRCILRVCSMICRCVCVCVCERVRVCVCVCVCNVCVCV